MLEQSLCLRPMESHLPRVSSRSRPSTQGTPVCAKWPVRMCSGSPHRGYLLCGRKGCWINSLLETRRFQALRCNISNSEKEQLGQTKILQHQHSSSRRRLGRWRPAEEQNFGRITADCIISRYFTNRAVLREAREASDRRNRRNFVSRLKA